MKGNPPGPGTVVARPTTDRKYPLLAFSSYPRSRVEL